MRKRSMFQRKADTDFAFTPVAVNLLRKAQYVQKPPLSKELPNGNAAFPEFHSVYMDPESFEHYERTGRFRNGTVVVKELLSVGAKQVSGGKGCFMGKFTGLEVAIKDAVRFPDEPGHWAYFSFGHKYPLKATASSQKVSSCSASHGGLADDDYVFTQYYPVLRAAKGADQSE